LGYIRDWESRWFETKKNYVYNLHQDLQLRDYVRKKLSHAGVSKIEIERAGKYVRLNIHTARPGIVIGKKGSDLENLKSDLEEISHEKIFLNVVPIIKPELDAQLIADGIAIQLEKKMPFRRVIKRAISKAMDGGADGIKVKVGGRLSGAEIARKEWFKEGRIPLQTFRANIGYGLSESHTTYGKIGVRVWIYKETARVSVEKEEPEKSPESPESKESQESKEKEDREQKTENREEDRKSPESPESKESQESKEKEDRKQKTENREEDRKSQESQESKEKEDREQKTENREEDRKSQESQESRESKESEESGEARTKENKDSETEGDK